MANNLSGEVATPDHLGCTPALPVIKHRGLYLPSLPLCSSTSPAPCGPMVERRRLGLDPSKLLGIQIVIGTNRFAKDGKSRNYVKIWQKLCERTKGLRQFAELIMQLTHNEGSLIGKIQNPSPCVGNCPIKHQFMTLILAL